MNADGERVGHAFVTSGAMLYVHSSPAATQVLVVGNPRVRKRKPSARFVDDDEDDGTGIAPAAVQPSPDGIGGTCVTHNAEFALDAVPGVLRASHDASDDCDACLDPELLLARLKELVGKSGDALDEDERVQLLADIEDVKVKIDAYMVPTVAPRDVSL